MIQLLIATLLVIIMLLLLFIIVGFFFFLFDIFLELPYVATKRNKIETIIKFAQIKEGETIVDLGSGDGRLLIASAQKGANAIGYEINPFLILITRIRARFLSLRAKRSNLKRRDRHGHQDDLAMTGRSSSRQARTIGGPVVLTGDRTIKGSVTVYKSNLWKADLKIADVVFVYGRKKTMQKFQDFVYKNCKKGTGLVVNTNPFPGKKATKEENGVFLYEV